MSINSSSGNHKIQGKAAAVIVAVVLLISFGFVFFLFLGSYAEPSYSFSGDNLIISGQFGVEINLSGAAVTLEHSQVPATETRTNGAAIGKIQKGYFKINASKVYLNIMDKEAAGYILITDKNGSEYYINCATIEETANLYNEIIAQNSSSS